jgi:hypothetical protein
MAKTPRGLAGRTTRLPQQSTMSVPIDTPRAIQTVAGRQLMSQARVWAKEQAKVWAPHLPRGTKIKIGSPKLSRSVGSIVGRTNLTATITLTIVRPVQSRRR